jgi:hypothetical protein
MRNAMFKRHTCTFIAAAILLFAAAVSGADAAGRVRPAQRLLLLEGAQSGFPAAGALLDDWFTQGEYFPGPAASNDLVDTRASSKFVTSLAGILTSVGNNVLPISNAGLLNEPAATNMLPQSQDLTNAGWIKSATTVGAATTAPDTTNTALVLLQTAATSAHFNTQNISLGNGTFIYSAFYKCSTSNFALEITNAASNAGAGVVFDGTNNVVVGNATTGSGVTVTGSGVIPSGNGFTRAYAIISTASGTANAGMWLQPALTTSWFPSFTGNTSNGCFLWGFMIEPDNQYHQPTSYVATTTTSATRAADSIQIQHTGIGTLVITYSDSTQQTLFLGPSNQFTLPTTLNKTLITRITGYATTAPLRQVASVTSFPDTSTSAATAMNFVATQALYRADTLQIVIPNCFGTNETQAATTLSGVTASAEYPSGTFTSFKFSGSTTGSTSGCTLTSDELAISVPAGASLNIRWWGQSSNSTFAACDNYSTGTSLYQGSSNFGAAVANTTTGGAISNSTAGLMACISVVAARHNSKAVAIYGDSITYGIGESGTTSGSTPVGGTIVPSLYTTIPVANYGVPSDTLNGFLSNSTFRQSLAHYFSSFGNAYGINDLNAGRTAVQLEADFASLAALLPGPTIPATVTPGDGSSTDNYATAVNQTPAPFNAQRTTFNNFVRAQSVFLDVTSPLEDVQNSGIWRNVGDGSAAQACTATGSPWSNVHPTNYAYGRIITSGNVTPGPFQ